MTFLAVSNEQAVTHFLIYPYLRANQLMNFYAVMLLHTLGGIAPLTENIVSSKIPCSLTFNHCFNKHGRIPNLCHFHIDASFK
jgi:hypothetical protein